MISSFRGHWGRSALAVTCLAGLMLSTACSAQPGAGGQAAIDEGTAFSVLTPNENTSIRALLDSLAAGACKPANDALPLENETVAQADVVQKMTLLASQGALPHHFVAGTAQVRPDGDLGKAGLLVDYEAELTTLGVADQVLPLAASTVKQVYGQMVSLPYQYNVEGIWYNKKIFADNGVAEPKTWDDLVATSETLKGKGITPITEGGAQGWPLTRLMGMYIFRNAGADAMKKVRDGQAKLTDEAYVAGAAALAELGAKGLLGEGVGSRETDAAQVQFLTGKAAMMYNGSWFLANTNDSEQNKIGIENVGFMPVPAVTGGTGSIDQWAANAGAATSMNKTNFGPKSAAWLKCIVSNYGQTALKEKGVISGFKVNGDVGDLPVTTKAVQEVVSNAKESVLWFEALFDAETNTLATKNVSLLVSGQMSPADYMAALQASLDAKK